MPGMVFNSFTLALAFARMVASACLIRALISSMKATWRSIWIRSSAKT